VTLLEEALLALVPYPCADQLGLAERRLSGIREGPLAAFEVAGEEARSERALDGRLLEAVAHRALAGKRGAVFTGPAEAELLAGFGLARVAARRGVDEHAALGALLGVVPARPELSRALAGVRVLDPSCGGGALLVAALLALRRVGAEPELLGIDISPLAGRATRARLALAGARSEILSGDALTLAWPAADLILSNPPFLRHESIAPAEKERAAGRSGLSRQADLSAHFAAVALRHAPDVAVVWPRALDTARSALPLLALASARGGFAYRLRSRVAGSFAASVDTRLAVWSLGGPARPAAEARVALAELDRREVCGLALGLGSARLGFVNSAGPRAAARVEDACLIRFGMKSGCNAFFHLLPVGLERYQSALVGELSLPPDAAFPLLASLKEAAAPALAKPRYHLFRPARRGARVRAYLALGESAGVPGRPTCAGRTPWWMVAPGRTPAPVLYPAKVGARAFAFLNAAGLWEDKKWHALFPREGLEPWLVAAALTATPVRLAVDRAARQLTGKQAIADVDCRILSAAPFPSVRALAALARRLEPCWKALAHDPVTTDLGAMLARPAQVELDGLVGDALGMGKAAVEAAREEMLERVATRLAHAGQVKRAVAGRAGPLEIAQRLRATLEPASWEGGAEHLRSHKTAR